jgi:hypothetical protein
VTDGCGGFSVDKGVRGLIGFGHRRLASDTAVSLLVGWRKKLNCAHLMLIRGGAKSGKRCRALGGIEKG